MIPIRTALIATTAILLIASLGFKYFRSRTVSSHSTQTSGQAQPSGNSPYNDSSDKGVDKGLETTVTLTETSRAKIPILTIQLGTTQLRSQVELTGEIQADPDTTQTLGTRIPGRILSIHKKEGDRVKKGDLLVEMDSPDIARLRSKFQVSQSRYFAAQKNFERTQELAKLKLASDQEARNAEAESRSWELEMKADREALEVLGISAQSQTTKLSYRSPLSGTLLRRLVAPGDSVAANTNFVVVGNLDRVWFTANVFEKDLSKVVKGKTVSVRLNAYPDEDFSGVVTYLGSGLDPNTRTLPARIELKNPDGRIKIGLSGRALLEEGGLDKTADDNSIASLAIPETALFTYQNETFVFVQESDLVYEWRKVRVGALTDGYYPVREGLSKGETVVTKGGYSLKAILLKSTFGEDE